MSSHLSHRSWTILLLLIGLSSLAACGGSGATTDVAPEAAATAPALRAERGDTLIPEPTATAAAPEPSSTSPPAPEPAATSAVTATAPAPTLTLEPTASPELTATATPPPPRVDKWMVTLVVELEEKSDQGGAEITSFADTVTYDFSFIVLRGEVKGMGAAQRQPDFAPELAGASVEDVICPDLAFTVKGTLEAASALIELVDRNPLSMCEATVSTSSTTEWVDYSSQLTAVLQQMALELPLQDRGTVAGSGVVEEVTEFGMTYELLRPMAYSYTATIDLFNPSLP